MMIGQHEALPTSLPGSPAAYDTGGSIEPLGQSLIDGPEAEPKSGVSAVSATRKMTICA